MSLGMRGFLFVLLVSGLVVAHVVSKQLSKSKEVLMKKKANLILAKHSQAKQFLSSLCLTAWSIGTSATAGALSA